MSKFLENGQHQRNSYRRPSYTYSWLGIATMAISLNLIRIGRQKTTMVWFVPTIPSLWASFHSWREGVADDVSIHFITSLGFVSYIIKLVCLRLWRRLFCLDFDLSLVCSLLLFRAIIGDTKLNILYVRRIMALFSAALDKWCSLAHPISPIFGLHSRLLRL